MKIRIKGNTIRLRFNQTELVDFEKTGKLSDSISFGVKQEEKLSFVVLLSTKKEIDTSFTNNIIEIHLPQEVAKNWMDTDLVSLGSSKKLNQGEELYILIEKDFQCLHKRPNEDETDNFPNPLATQNIN